MTTDHPGQSGFRALLDNKDALATRIALIDRATTSIDLQYYIFDNDATGKLLALHLLQATDRHVRVRILVDDINLEDEAALLDVLDASPLIEVRVFNPLRTRDASWLSRLGQFALEARRLNRRMHNKSFLVDNVAAIVGGRNIGDGYFDADGTTNFRDLDVAMIGPVVAGASRAFDDYWNSDAAYPVSAFRGTRRRRAELSGMRAALAQELRNPALPDSVRQAQEDTSSRLQPLFWGKAALTADEPEKAEPGRGDAFAVRLSPEIDAVIRNAKSEALLVSPYFIPGKAGAEYLRILAHRGVNVEILTNSLVSTDELVAHAAYSHYRLALLRAGVRLHELRPDSTSPPPPATTHGLSAGTSLHAKMVVIDRRHVVIGSMNLDLRSRLYNTETGVLIDSPAFAEELCRFFADATAPRNAYEVVLEHEPGSSREHMAWLTSEHGIPLRYGHEPEADTGRRLRMLLLRIFPIDNLL